MSATNIELERRIGELQHDIINKDQIILLQIESMKKLRARVDELESIITLVPKRASKYARA